MVYHKDLIWRPGRLFTFGIQGEGAYLKQGGNQGQDACCFFFFKNKQKKALMFI